MQIQSGTPSTSKLEKSVGLQAATSCVDHSALVERMLVDYHGAPWCELPILLSCLRALAFTHQVSHWVANGDPFYGDHLLFERLYNAVVPEIDKVAEKSVGMGGSVMLNPQHQVVHEALLVQTMCPAGTHLPNSEELARRSHEAELHFLQIVEALANRMQSSGSWSLGVENMVGAIVDKHEEHVYLLKQRIIG